MKNLTIIQKKSVFSSIANLKLILSAGAYLIRGDYALDATHTLSPEENALLIVTTRRGLQAARPTAKIRHSLVICSQGGFYDDQMVWSGEDIKALQAAVEALQDTKLGLEFVDKINGAAQKTAVSKALEVIELTDNNTQNKAAIDARIAKLTELGVDLTNGYAIPISYISGNKEYHGMVTAGKNSLLNGIVSDAQGQSYFGISVGATDGIVTFEEGDPLVFKSEMSSAIDTLVECVEFTKTTLSNKVQLDAYLAKLPNAKVMCCTYNGGYAGTLHKINGSWYGVLVSESNTLAGQLSIKLQADGTIVEGTA